LIFFIIFYLLYRKIFKQFGSHKLLHDAAKIDDLQKTFYMILNIKLDSLEEYFRSKFKLNTQLSSKSTFVLSFINEFSKPLIETIVMILIFIVLSLFHFYFKISKFEIFSMLSIFVVGMFRILPSCNRILIGFNNIKYHTSGINLIYNQIKEVEIIEPENPCLVVAANYSFKESIVFKNINFSYPDKNLILKNINLRIKKNEIIGIKGKSGSGKTTLLNILCCLLKPTSGSIFIDEQLLTIEFEKFFKEKIGYVSQKIYLFNDTLVKNIIFGLNKKYYDEKLFEKAIKLSNLDPLLLDLKEGRETVVGERGIRFSGGQQQKIGIARALYKDPDIIIFDEATSSLDFISENEILNTIKNLRNQKTIVIVSHKESSFAFCDSIYELKDGYLIKIK
jgi:ATP-binding cassette subfamily C protein